MAPRVWSSLGPDIARERVLAMHNKSDHWGQGEVFR